MFDCFVLGAGLGTRLRPLTDVLPKPLVPVGLKPLVTFAFDHLIAEAAADEFLVNTHHLPAAWPAAFPDGQYRGRSVRLVHEPDILETGGGIRNLLDLGLLRADRTLLVYNGDIFTDLPLAPALAAHQASGRAVTLILRSHEGPRHVAFDAATGRVRDIRNRFGEAHPHEHAFTGIYLVEHSFIARIPAATKLSVIPIIVEILRGRGEVGGVVADGGIWRDLGSRKEYLAIHRELADDPSQAFPRYGAPDPGWRNWIHSAAEIAPNATLRGACAVGTGARIGAGVVLESSLIWPGGEVAASARLAECVVRSGSTALGDLRGKDV